MTSEESVTGMWRPRGGARQDPHERLVASRGMIGPFLRISPGPFSNAGGQRIAALVGSRAIRTKLGLGDSGGLYEKCRRGELRKRFFVMSVVFGPATLGSLSPDFP